MCDCRTCADAGHPEPGDDQWSGKPVAVTVAAQALSSQHDDSESEHSSPPVR